MTPDEFREMVRALFGQKRVVELSLGKEISLKQSIKRNPYWIFLYNWGIINGGTPRVVSAGEIIESLRRNQFPPIGKS